MYPLPLVDGWIWQEQWGGPCEGPFSICAKAVQVNAVHYQRLWDWAVERSDDRKILGHPSIRQYICSQNLRYCLDCIATGYHASIFQVWRIKVCPTHNSPLLTACTGCGAATPLFPLVGRPKVAPTLRCGQCHKPYGGDQEICPSKWHSRGDQKLRGLRNSLCWLADFGVSHDNLDKWRPLSAFPQSLEAEIVGTTLLDILKVIRRDSRPPAESYNYLLGPPRYQARPDRLPLPQRPIMTTPVRFHQRPIGLREGLAEDSNDTVLPSFNVRVPVNRSVSSFAHANTLCDAQQSNFWNWDFTSRLWEGDGTFNLFDALHHAKWTAAVKIAQQWNQQLVALHAQADSSVSDAALLACTPFWRGRLGRWADFGYSPVLAFVSTSTSRRYLGVL